MNEFGGGIARRNEFAGQAFVFTKTQRFLLLHKDAKVRIEVLYGGAQRGDGFPFGGGTGRRNVVERLQGHFLPLGEIPDFPVGGMRHEARGGGAHQQ